MDRFSADIRPLPGEADRPGTSAAARPGLISKWRAAGASVINTAYFSLQILLFLAATPWLFRTLGGREYGLWTILVSVMSLAGLANFGTATAMSKYVAQARGSENDDLDQRFSEILTFGFVLLLATGIVAALAIWLLRFQIAGIVQDKQPGGPFALALALTGFGVVPLMLTQAAKGVLLGLVRNELSGGLDLLQRLLLLGGTLVLGLNSVGIAGLAAWMMLANTAVLFISAAVLGVVLRPFRLRPRWNREFTKAMASYQFLTWVSALGNTLFNSADSILVGAVISPVAAGVYGICTGVAIGMHAFVGSVTQVLVPYSSSQLAAGRREEVQAAFTYSSKLIACLLAAIASVLIIWSHPLLSVWISTGFANKYAALFGVIVGAYAMLAMSAPAQQIAQGVGRLTLPAAAIVIGGVGTLVAILALTPSLGIVGAGIANLAYVVVLATNFYIARVLGLSPVAGFLRALAVPLGTLAVVFTIVNLSGPAWPLSLILTVLSFGILVWHADVYVLIWTVRQYLRARRSASSSEAPPVVSLSKDLFINFNTPSALKPSLDGAARYALSHYASGPLGLYMVTEYPRSGGTWLSYMLSDALGVPFPRNRFPILGSQVLHGHYLFHPGMKHVVVMTRDGRDVMTSMYFHSLFKNGLYNAQLVEATRRALGIKDPSDCVKYLPRFLEYLFTEKGFLGFSWTEFHDSWLNRGTHVVRYEELLQRTPDVLGGALSALKPGDTHPAELQRIADKYSFSNLANRPQGEERVDRFFRKGIAGDWRSKFSVEAADVFNHYAGDMLITLGYEKDDSWVHSVVQGNSRAGYLGQ